jgi:hypothetical protein
MLKEKEEFFLDEKGCCKEGFVQKIVDMERRDKDKPSEFRMLYEGLSKF